LLSERAKRIDEGWQGRSRGIFDGLRTFSGSLTTITIWPLCFAAYPDYTWFRLRLEFDANDRLNGYRIDQQKDPTLMEGDEQNLDALPVAVVVILAKANTIEAICQFAASCLQRSLELGRASL
jgi:hypothetical protein